MPTLVTDDFNRADSGSLGANWTDVVNGLDIASNQAVPGNTTNALNLSVYTGFGAFPNNQWAQAKVNRQGSSSDGGVVVRCSNSAQTMYWFNIGDDTSAAIPGTLALNILKGVAGSYSVVSSSPAGGSTMTISAGDVLYIEAQGTSTVTIICKVNGVTVMTGTDSSSPIASGFPGLFPFQHNNDALSFTQYDDFAAGDFASAFIAKQNAPLRQAVKRAAFY